MTEEPKTATYRGRQYRLLVLKGKTAKLEWLDGSRTFWVATRHLTNITGGPMPADKVPHVPHWTERDDD